MLTRCPATCEPQTNTRASFAEDSPEIASTLPASSTSQLLACARFLVRRRVPVSLVAFASILTTEGMLGIAWHRVNFGSDVLFGVAVAMVLMGVAIRSWAAGTIRKNSDLATSGPYSLCRHPLYLGSFLMIVGFCLGTQPQINLPIVTPLVVLIYICAIRSEESTLAQLFGADWSNYSATTPRLIPNPLRSKIQLSRWSAEQWRSNREYQAALGAIAGIGGMFAWYALA